MLETGALEAGFGAGFGAGAGASFPFSGSSARSFFVATFGVVFTTDAGLEAVFLLAALPEDAALELAVEPAAEEPAAELTAELSGESAEEAEELSSQSAVEVFEAVWDVSFCANDAADKSPGNGL